MLNLKCFFLSFIGNQLLTYKNVIEQQKHATADNILLLQKQNCRLLYYCLNTFLHFEQITKLHNTMCTEVVCIHATVNRGTNIRPLLNRINHTLIKSEIKISN